ncbi:MAG: hypothetical protein U1F58_19115 [Burkholderiales bacterium]
MRLHARRIEYRIRGRRIARPGPPSFEQLSMTRGAGKPRENVFVTAYQSNQLLLFRHDQRRPRRPRRAT